jgi:general secretion pathway protein C
MQKSLFWGALVGLLGTTAYLDARGITALIGATMAVDAHALAQSPQVIVITRGEDRPTAAPILAHNPFEPNAPLVPPVTPEPSRDPRDAAPCEGLAVRVIAFADDPEWSLASLWDTRGARSIVSRRGDAVDGQSVAFIGRDRVWLSRGGTLCQIEMYAPHDAARVSAKPSVATPTEPPKTAGIKREGENEYAVDRSLLDRMLDDPAELMKLAQTIPEKVDGRIVGFRLRNVRPGSLLGAIGLMEGDRLEKVNGYELTGPEKILEAYAHLREVPRLTVQISRAGKTMNFDYAIR